MKVSSVDEMRHALHTVEPQVQLKFRLAPDMPLGEVTKLWESVKADGGECEISNPDRLVNKEEALRCVNYRLERLRRWKRNLDRKREKVYAEGLKLGSMMHAGGPGARPGYEAHSYQGPAVFFDKFQKLEKEDMKEHIEALRELVLQEPHASPSNNGGPGSVADCDDREEKEQMDIAKFNLAYLNLKDKGLGLLSDFLVSGIAELKKQFVDEPTHLGAADADFVRFIDVPMCPKEAPPEGWSP